jgi:hypothetical protein
MYAVKVRNDPAASGNGEKSIDDFPVLSWTAERCESAGINQQLNLRYR